MAACPEVGQLIDTLGSKGDRLWPSEKWPPMRFDRSLQIGASGGHGPIRYTIDRYDPGQTIRFRFLSPRGFHGTHGFEVVSSEPGKCKLVHTLEMITSGMAILAWPVIYRPLHDALLEDLLDKAERNFSDINRSREWSSWVKFLRWGFRLFKIRK